MENDAGTIPITSGTRTETNTLLQRSNKQQEEKDDGRQQTRGGVEVEGSFSSADRHYHAHHSKTCEPHHNSVVPPMKKRGNCDGLMGYGIEESFFVCSPEQGLMSQLSQGLSMQWLGSTHTSTQQSSDGTMQCHYNPTTKASFCEARNLQVDASMIEVAKGGEPIPNVQGRKEAKEFPVYSKGAFQLSQCSLNKTILEDETESNFQGDRKQNKKLPFHLLDMMEAVQVTNTANKCAHYEERPTLFVTRYEYANLYHTLTDYYNAYQDAMMAVEGDSKSMDSINIVFFDGHARGTLDVGWELLFPNADISYVSELSKKQGNTCFRHAIFVSPGYRSGVSIVSFIDETVTPYPPTYLPKCGKNEWQVDFRERIIHGAKCRLQLFKGWMVPQHTTDDNTGGTGKRSATTTTVRVLFMLRKNHFSHPRMNGATTRQIENEDEVESVLHNVSGRMRNDSHGPVHIDTRRLILEQHDLAEQILIIQQADIVIGMHGAGLSHIFWARPGTLLIELKPPGFESHGHFEPLTQLAGGLYQAFLNLGEPRDAEGLTNRVPIPRFQQTFETSVDTFIQSL